MRWLLASVLVASCYADTASPPRVHMATFTTKMYQDRFTVSLQAKQDYAKHWGYSFEVFDEHSLDCEQFRPHRWRGDYRYCKLEALKVMWHRIKGGGGAADYIFWHDVDTHILQPEVPLHAFLEKAAHAPVVFTDNALSLNNGALFLKVSSGLSGKFLKQWRRGCRKGEWPWADNGCMYEVMLQFIGGDRYRGSCRQFRVSAFNEKQPEPPTGNQLMRCFNKEMDSLGHACCGMERRGFQDFGLALLSGRNNSFNDHPCDELQRSKDFTKEERAKIAAHCFSDDGMFMVHTKNTTYADISARRVSALLAKGHSEL